MCDAKNPGVRNAVLYIAPNGSLHSKPRASFLNGTTTVTMAVKDTKLKAQTGATWGRDRDISTLTVLGSIFILTFCPTLTFWTWISCTHYQCSIFEPVFELAGNNFSSDAIRDFILTKAPQYTYDGFKIYFTWLFFQGILYAVLPANIGYGQRTPAGYLLPYKVNGLLAWFVTHTLYLGGSYLGWWDPAIVHNNWGGLLMAANVYGYFLTFFAFAKAYVFPSHPEDRKFSGSWVYDLLMGIEMNPRFGQLWDFKLFHNGRPGIVAWTLINLSFAAAQYQKIGYVTNSMILLNILHATYVLDFFYNEDWYLRTIDIAHDHFGFYLAWGDSVWLPFMYTLQSHYLARNPVDLSTPYFILVTIIGFSGYYIFRAVNNQKDLVRTMNGNCNIWGKPANVIRTQYTTSDGKVHRSLLLTSGFWGM
ncbi:ergosterol biosynthesis ERG4/ERG24 [Jimgerdemannia flammicorona]|uniref:7-dehydrocholesterol reductase n=1 Tax=Jimgerdemannia flammicorona TaxID=994334 RepID=A0A433Q1T9_9FUNG|nr:ergosterol biosynthesis ERG4/ERG24 [Jimgerdemannia flammicorona]